MKCYWLLLFYLVNAIIQKIAYFTFRAEGATIYFCLLFLAKNQVTKKAGKFKK